MIWPLYKLSVDDMETDVAKQVNLRWKEHLWNGSAVDFYIIFNIFKLF